MPLVLARLEIPQRLAAELTLHDRRHQHDRALDLAFSVQVRESAEHDRGLARAGPEPEAQPLVGLKHLDRALLRRVLAVHRNIPELHRLPGLELAPDDAHHPGDLHLRSMPQRVTFVGRQRRGLLDGVVSPEQVLGREEPHLRLLERGLLLLGGVQLVLDRPGCVLACHAVAQGVDQLALLGRPGFARSRIHRIEVVQVVADHGPPNSDGRVRAQAVVMLSERLRNARADHVLQRLVGLRVTAHRVDVLLPVERGLADRSRQLVAPSPPLGPLRVGGGLAEHIDGFLLRLGRKVALVLVPQVRSLGRLVRNLPVEKIPQRALVLLREVAHRLVRGNAIRVIGERPVQRIDRHLIDVDLLAVQRQASRAALLDKGVRVGLKLALQRLGAPHFALGVLERRNRLERRGVLLAPLGAGLVEECRRLDVRHNVRRRVAIGRAPADVVAQ